MANSSISGGILPVKKAKDMWETGPIESKHQFQPTLCTHGRDQCAFHSHTVDGRQTHPCSISWGNQGCLSCRRGRGWQRNQQFDGPCAGWGVGLQIYSNKPRCKELHVHMFHHPNTAQSQPVSVSSLFREVSSDFCEEAPDEEVILPRGHGGCVSWADWWPGHRAVPPPQFRARVGCHLLPASFSQS